MTRGGGFLQISASDLSLRSSQSISPQKRKFIPFYHLKRRDGGDRFHPAITEPTHHAQETESMPIRGSRSRSCGLTSKAKEHCEIPMKTLEDILARHPFWNNLPPQYFPLLIECAVIEHFGPASRFSRKVTMRSILFDSSRQSRLRRLRSWEGLITIQTLGAGEALGWSWLFPPYQWHFSARAVERPKPSSSRRMLCVTKQKKTPLSDTILPCGWVA
jgi:hypothetical protein